MAFKPGYGSFPDGRIYPPKGAEPSFEEFFSEEIGKVIEVDFQEPWKMGAEHKKISLTFGIVELPKLKTREERLDAKRSADIFGLRITAEDLPLLYKVISEENKNLGLE